MLEVRGLSRLFLTDVSFVVDAGQCVALMGPSGSGKSTLLRAIADLDPNHGQVTLEGKPRSAFDGPSWRSRVTYQAANAGWWHENVGAHFASEARARRLAEDLGLPAEAFGWPVSRLSSGEKQRLALVRVLESDARVLLLDEPTANLDGDSAERVEELLRTRAREGSAILVATHNEEQAKRLASRRLLIDAGKIRETSMNGSSAAPSEAPSL